MMTRHTPILGTLISLVLIQGCSTTVQVQEMPCPPQPLLHPITIEEQQQIDPDVLERLANNQIELKAYAKRLRVRAKCK